MMKKRYTEDFPAMMSGRIMTAAAAETMSQAECGKQVEPANQIEALQQENEKLRYHIRDLESELLNVLRKLNNYI